MAGARLNNLLKTSACVKTVESGNSWFAVHTRSSAEKVASLQIQAYEIKEFLPLHRVGRRWFDQVKLVSLPLFIGHLFCRCDRRGLAKASSASALANRVRRYPRDQGVGDERFAVSPCPFMR